MKKLTLLMTAAFVVMALIIGCSDDTPTESSSNNNLGGQLDGQARLVVTAFDAPPPEGIEHLFLNIVEVAIHHENEGWIVVSDIDTTIDFLQLINGVTVTLVDDSIPAGYVSQLRLVVSDSNEIVVDSVSYPLTIPSGTQTGVKLNLDFDVSPNEFVNLYVDFDVSKSVIVANDKFKLKPTYRVFKENLAGSIAGMVTDTLSNPLGNVLIEAASSEYSTSTVTDSLGIYMLILPAGTYSLTATADSLSLADTSYSDIILQADDILTGYDFIIQ